MTTGVAFTSVVAMWAEMYGVRNIGAIKSLVSPTMVFASALGPPFMGVLIDAGVGVICLIFAALCGCRRRPDLGRPAGRSGAPRRLGRDHLAAHGLSA